MNEYPAIVYSFGPKVRQEGGELTDEVVSALSAGDGPFEALWDLCELAAGGDPAICRWAASDDLRVVGLPRRAVKWLFHAAGAALPESAEVLDPEATAGEEIISRLAAATRCSPSPDPSGHPLPSPSRERGCQPPPAEAMTVVLYEGPGAAAMPAERLAELVCAAVAAGYRVIRPGRGRREFPIDTSAAAVVGEFNGNGESAGPTRDGRDVCIDASGKCPCGVMEAVAQARERANLPRPAQWVPWFPVIDYDRCVGCNQCANFCLFGVYTTDGGLRVIHPAGCKTNCPACARMCPKSAILFPYYPTGPINGREAPADAPAQVDLKEALKGDVYQVLRNRGLAGAAPCACAAPSPADLARIAEQVEIPPQVLMSLGVSGPAGPKARACECDGAGGDNGGCDCGCDCDRGQEPKTEN